MRKESLNSSGWADRKCHGVFGSIFAVQLSSFRFQAEPPPHTMSTPPIQRILENFYCELKDEHSGTVATYIPELGKANPDWFGICLVTADGQVYTVGDCAQMFTIQSISKPFIYGAALEDNGKAAILEKVWMEPSGEAFNAISLRPGSGKPENPMINAGAITSTSLVEGQSAKQKVYRILDALGRYAGRSLTVDHSVYESESSTGHRNRAIGYMLRNFEILENDPGPSLEAYFKQCSVSVNCRDLGMMAGTLANGGVNPVTGTRAVVREYVENILSVMGSCGMYDAAGEWIYNVGMPAKSGVSGGILAVLPGQLGIGVFSPRLDSHGNSIRGVEVCRRISRKFGLHMFNVPQLTTAVVRRISHLGVTHSTRLRSQEEMEALKASGESIRIIDLQGSISFGSAEVAVRELFAVPESVKEIIMDFSHVTALDFSGAGIIAMAISSWLNMGKQMNLCRCENFPILEKRMRMEMPERWKEVRIDTDRALSLEAVENALLDELALRCPSSRLVALETCELLKGLDAQCLDLLKTRLVATAFDEGATIMRSGDPPGSLYFVLRGKASAWIKTESGHTRRVAVFSPGTNFGEMALLDGLPRSAEIRAECPLETMELSQDAFLHLAEEAPQLQICLLINLSRILAERLREANIELSTLHR